MSLRLIATNQTLFNDATLILSTVKLPTYHDGYYETCLFTQDGDSDVLKRHQTIEEAASYHKRKAFELGLK